MDEVERRRAYNTIKTMIDTIEDVITKNALVGLLHMVMSLEQRIDEMGGDEDE